MKKILLFLPALLLLASGCDSQTSTVQNPPSQPTNHQVQPPNDFNFVFRYGIGAKNELDTFKEMYTKDMVSDPGVKTEMPLTDEEMSGIYKKILDTNFFDYPDTFSVSVPNGELSSSVNPCSSYYFKVSTDSKTKELSWDDCIINKDEKARKLRELITYIENVIESKKEYKDLPTPKAGYQ